MELPRELSERHRFCTRVHMCVCVYVLFLFHSSCEKNSDGMKKNCSVLSEKQRYTAAILRMKRKIIIKISTSPIYFPFFFLSSLEVPPLYFRALLWLMTDLSKFISERKICFTSPSKLNLPKSG